MADHGSIDFLKELIKAGGSIDAKGWNSYTPLMYACRNGNFDEIKFLVEAGADIDTRDGNGVTNLMKVAGHPDMINYLLDHGANLNIQDGRGRTLLWQSSAISANPDLVKLLIGRKADLNITDWLGTSALIAAAQYGHLDIVQMLLDAGADPTIRSKNGYTALDIAIYTKRSEIATVIAAKMNVPVAMTVGQNFYDAASRDKENVMSCTRA